MADKKNKVHVKTGDTVVVLSGTQRGKKGKVLQVSPKEGKGYYREGKPCF